MEGEVKGEGKERDRGKETERRREMERRIGGGGWRGRGRAEKRRSEASNGQRCPLPC